MRSSSTNFLVKLPKDFSFLVEVVFFLADEVFGLVGFGTLAAGGARFRLSDASDMMRIVVPV